MMPLAPLAPLAAFPRELSRGFDRRAEALFELPAALLPADPIASPAYLSREPVHRRGWGRLYAALAHGPLASPGLRALIGRHPWVMGSRARRWT